MSRSVGITYHPLISSVVPGPPVKTSVALDGWPPMLTQKAFPVLRVSALSEPPNPDPGDLRTTDEGLACHRSSLWRPCKVSEDAVGGCVSVGEARVVGGAGWREEVDRVGEHAVALNQRHGGADGDGGRLGGAGLRARDRAAAGSARAAERHDLPSVEVSDPQEIAGQQRGRGEAREVCDVHRRVSRRQHVAQRPRQAHRLLDLQLLRRRSSPCP
eukprot:742288-Rhodomonas_salina.2